MIVLQNRDIPILLVTSLLYFNILAINVFMLNVYELYEITLVLVRKNLI